ncbi:Terpene synthase 10 [Ananas comosus]|uniref:Terpene synthase 10 n=1 Tax=Ananas comosus TaxID=4615 RepID=A0A199UWG1_ANACO|nr:Terpene synthase 10 [Ananas comosus]
MREKGLNILPSIPKKSDLTQHDLDLFQNYPEIVQWSSMLLRLYNDLGTSKPEHQRGDVAKSIHCCMHHERITEAAARERIKELIYDCWKKLNGARRVDSAFNENFANIAMNVPRTARSFYIYGDGYGSPEGETKDRIISLLIERHGPDATISMPGRGAATSVKVPSARHRRATRGPGPSWAYGPLATRPSRWVDLGRCVFGPNGLDQNII